MDDFANDQSAVSDGSEDRYLTFIIGTDEYALHIADISDIIRVDFIADVPEVPPFIRGIINLRGKILPVIDVRIRFNKEPIPYDDRTCIIVVTVNNDPVGLIVDTVSEVLNILPEDITPPTRIDNSELSAYISGIGKCEKGIILLLDLEKLAQW